MLHVHFSRLYFFLWWDSLWSGWFIIFNKFCFFLSILFLTSALLGVFSSFSSVHVFASGISVSYLVHDCSLFLVNWFFYHQVKVPHNSFWSKVCFVLDYRQPWLWCKVLFISFRFKLFSVYCRIKLSMFFI